MDENEWFEKAWECMDNEDYVQAKEYFEKAAKEGVAEAYCDLGNLYFDGNGVAQDYKQAFEMYLKGAKTGDPDCMDNLGMCYFWGHGTETDLQKSAFYNEKAAKAGVVRAMFDMGLNYERGYGVGQNIEQALYWLEKAAEENYPEALLELGSLYFIGEFVEKDLEKSFNYYQRGVEIGDVCSKLMISTFYEEGLVVEKDLEKAKALNQEAYDTLYELAVIEDEKVAQLRLGNIYFSGQPSIGIDIDYLQAAKWYEKAAKKGLDHAQNNLGNMYAFGIGVTQNYEKAVYWYSQAAERMHRTAITNLANFYSLGRGVEQDKEKAAELYAKAANLGDSNAQVELGKAYMQGEGVEKNPIQAVKWLRMAYEQGKSDAFGYLGDCYLEGFCVEKDEQKAFSLYQQGAEADDLYSKVKLAESYIEGWGTKIDITMASELLTSICDEENAYRENLTTIVISPDDSGGLYIGNPLDPYDLVHYGKAYYLLGVIRYAGSDGKKKDVNEAILLLRMADKLGYVDETNSEESPQNLLKQINKNTPHKEICDSIDSFVEISDQRDDKGKLYSVFIHHADESVTKVKFSGRNKFLYILALLVSYKGSSVSGLTTKHFSIMKESLKELAITIGIDINDYGKWVDEFIYKADEENEIYGGPDQSKYSNALTGAKTGIEKACINDEERRMFSPKSTCGRNSVTIIPIDPSQITIPPSLMKFLDKLPTTQDIANHEIRKSVIWE